MGQGGMFSVLAGRPRYAPSTTKADWIEYSESLEAEVERLLATLEVVAPFVSVQSGSYSEPRVCEHRDCDMSFLSRADYWVHRLEHEREDEEASRAE